MIVSNINFYHFFFLSEILTISEPNALTQQDTEAKDTYSTRTPSIQKSRNIIKNNLILSPVQKK